MRELIAINEDFEVPGTEVTLEEGDHVGVLKEVITYNDMARIAQELVDHMLSGEDIPSDGGEYMSDWTDLWKTLFDEVLEELDQQGVTGNFRDAMIQSIAVVARNLK